MSDHYSRRSFLSGVIACGALTASALYLSPGGRRNGSSSEPMTVRLITGGDSTGGRQQLYDRWKAQHPEIRLQVLPAITSGTGDERTVMLEAARNGRADILNLDVIHIPEFAQRGLITPVTLKDGVNFLTPIQQLNQVKDEADRYWAAPFNTDVGMLFARPTSPPPVRPPTLAEVLDRRVAAGSQQFVGQLGLSDSTSNEAFVINVLEHALARDSGLLTPDGTVALDLHRWQAALDPLRAAVRQHKIYRATTEAESLDTFRQERRLYMRNWPVKLHELRQSNDVDAGQIQLSRLPIGILGGQSLAVAANSPVATQARQVIEFLTGVEAQKILAAHGLPPTQIAAYDDPDLRTAVPQLATIRAAIENENSRPRPVHPNYRVFSDVVRRHVTRLLDEDTGADLPQSFVDDIQRALS